MRENSLQQTCEEINEYISLHDCVVNRATLADDTLSLTFDNGFWMLGGTKYNTAVERDGVCGWLNIDAWASVPWERNEKTVTFYTEFLKISFTGIGIEGGCPAEKDNEGTFFASGANFVLRKPETILSKKEFCDCSFAWSFTANDAKGKSMGKTLSAIPTEVRTVYPKQSCTAQHAAEIPCIQVLGAYLVKFER